MLRSLRNFCIASVRAKAGARMKARVNCLPGMPHGGIDEEGGGLRLMKRSRLSVCCYCDSFPSFSSLSLSLSLSLSRLELVLTRASEIEIFSHLFLIFCNAYSAS
jgi:hypothetical protein